MHETDHQPIPTCCPSGGVLGPMFLEVCTMMLQFYDLNQYESYAKAFKDGAIRQQYIEDNLTLTLATGHVQDVVQAVLSAATMVDGNADVQFILFDDDGKFLDVC
jgi:hypothetical protein